MSQPLNPPTSPVPGAIYTEELTGISWVWTGVAWIEGGPSSNYSAQIRTGMALTPGYYSGLSTSQTGGSGTNLAAIATQYGATAPTNPSFGQLWVDTTDTTQPITNVWVEPGEWKKVSDGVTNTHVTSIQPTSPDTGDSWLNTASNAYQIWDGSNWVVLGGGSSNIASSIASYSVAPAPLVEGSVYYNTTDDKMYISNGSAWIEIDTKPDDDTNSIVAISAPSIRPSGEALQAGDNWIDSSANSIYYYNGSAWVKIASATAGDTHSFYANSAPTVRPDSTALVSGDIWVNSSDQSANVWTGSLWSPLSFPDTSNTNSIVAATQPIIRPSSGALTQGDLWVNSTTFGVSYWTGAAWVPITAASTTDIDTHSIYDAAQPTVRTDGSALQAGDQWVNSANNVLSYYTGSAWVAIETSVDVDTHAIYNTIAPTVRANGDPIGAGDQWLNSLTGELSYYNGSTWLLVVDSVKALPDTFGKVLGHTSDDAGFAPNGTTALGHKASNTTVLTGTNNTLIGTTSGEVITSGTGNTAVGFESGKLITTGSLNTVLGSTALQSENVGSNNIALGYSAMGSSTGNSFNIALGYAAGKSWSANGSKNISIGHESGQFLSGSSNITLGSEAGEYVTTNNSVIIGHYPNNTGAAANETVPDGTLILARNDSTSPSTLLRINESNAFGLPVTNGSVTVNYGTSGQFLTSQGTTAPPNWTTITLPSVYMGMSAEYPGPTLRPDGTALVAGDHYFNNDALPKNAENYWWSGSAWLSASNVILEGTTAAGPTSRSSSVSQQLVENDFYIDETNADLYRYDGAAWQLLTKSGVPDFQASTGALPTTRSDASALVAGDIFHETVIDRKYFYTGSIWESNGSHNFMGTSTPPVTFSEVGDTWVNTATMNQFVYFFDGVTTQWVQIV